MPNDPGSVFNLRAACNWIESNINESQRAALAQRLLPPQPRDGTYYKCMNCKTIFNSEEECEIHYRDCTNIRYCCDKCHTIFDTQSDRDAHCSSCEVNPSDEIEVGDVPLYVEVGFDNYLLNM